MDGLMQGEESGRTVLAPVLATADVRSRLMSVGAAGASDAELLAVLVSLGTRQGGALGVATRLLERFDGPGGLGRAHLQALTDEAGMGIGRALTIVAAMELGRRSLLPGADRPRLSTPDEAALHYRPRLAALDHEVFHIGCLDARGRLLRDVRIAEGTAASCAVQPREVFAAAVRERALAVLLVHNHPSGDPDPSPEDVQLTLRLVEAGRVIGIPVVDHLIVAQGGHRSLARLGYFR